jgi:hypothetical protein
VKGLDGKVQPDDKNGNPLKPDGTILPTGNNGNVLPLNPDGSVKVYNNILIFQTCLL